MQANKSTIPDLYPPEETAKKLSVSVDTLSVWRCTRRYDLPFVKIGRNVMYTSDAIADFIRSRTVGANQET